MSIYLFTDSFPTESALDGVFNNGVIRSPSINHSDDVQGKSHAEKVENLIKECSIGHDDGTIFLRPFDCVVATLRVAIMWTPLQDREFLVEIFGYERKQ